MKPKMDSFSKRALPKPARWRHSSPRAQPTRRTTLNGEGLQHQDGHSLVLSSTIPTLLTYDPAFSYELAVIIAEGMRRMYVEGEDIFYYLSLYNENYVMPPMAEGGEEGILKGLYKFKP